MKKIAKIFLQPLRNILRRIVLPENCTGMVKPIDVAATYVCAENVPGDYLEFGTFKGDSFIEAYRKIESAIQYWGTDNKNYTSYTDKSRWKNSLPEFKKKEPVRYFAFDSFDGLPDPQGIDKGHPRLCKGRYDCSEEQFKKNLRDNDVNLSKVITVPGYYEKTLTSETKRLVGLKSAAIVMLDCDFYESTKLVLDFITDLIADGTIIIFDDWFVYRGNPELGMQRACREWLERNPSISLAPYARWGHIQMCFIVSKRAS